MACIRRREAKTAWAAAFMVQAGESAHAAMAAAHARDAARAVAATHEARTHRAMRTMRIDVAHGRMRIVRAIAAGIEMDLRLGGADGAEYERDGGE